MSTATAPLAAGFTLTGTTFARDTAPIFYSIAGPSFGLAIGEQYSLAALSRIRQSTSPDGKIEVYIDNLLLKRFDTSGEAASVIASINQAVGTISRSIQQQATNAGPAPTPAPAPRPVTQPANTNITNTTNTTRPDPIAVTPDNFNPTALPAPDPAPNPILRTRPEPIAVTADVDPITGRTEPISVTSGDPALAIDDAPIIGDILSEPPPTTDPNFPLPLGDDIDDIYDPNLTPEQIASLSPGDQAARANVLADEAAGLNEPGTFDAEQEIIVTGARQQQQAFQSRKDWRVRLALSDDPSVNYLYRAPNPGILNPLNATNGVLFPYTPTISVNYAANYNPTELVHSNYKVFQYSSSSVDSITITCDFTAQDTYEANYLLAVIHFFRAATKMFYGQDENPRRGTPPPLCYIYGMGSYQFAAQPLAVSQFSYNLPNSVDYIKTSVGGNTTSVTSQPSRMAGTGAAKGGVLPPPNFTPIAEPDTVSWVPSKIQLSITCVPMMNRNSVSNGFSFQKYATGELLNGVSKRFGGFW